MIITLWVFSWTKSKKFSRLAAPASREAWRVSFSPS